MKTIAVIGAQGQLGAEVAHVLSRSHGDRVCPLSHADIDVADAGSVREALSRARPSVVVNCAAFHRVDDCEDQPDVAMRVNGLGALYVARACAEVGARCVYVSSDYVFGAAGRAPYSEDDPPGAVNVYGASKILGEQLVSQGCAKALVVRVAGLYGTAGSRARGGNFVNAVIAKARAGQPVTVVCDARVSPTYARDAAEGLARLIAAGAEGIVHLTNTGSCSWHEFALRAVRCAGLDVPVVPIASAQYPMKARRPHDSSLRSVRLAALIGSPLRRWEEALGAYLAHRAPVA